MKYFYVILLYGFLICGCSIITPAKWQEKRIQKKSKESKQSKRDHKAVADGAGGIAKALLQTEITLIIACGGIMTEQYLEIHVAKLRISFQFTG